jgi:hypothetical protein
LSQAQTSDPDIADQSDIGLHALEWRMSRPSTSIMSRIFDVNPHD